MISKKIVVVDDDESIRKTFFLILQKKFRVFPVKDAKEALSRFKSANFDLIIADINLPDLNGMDMIGKFRALGYKGEAILISAHPDLVRMDDMRRFSISHFFVKPLDLGALNKSIDYLLFSKEQEEKRLGG
jgi:two-component system response regulator YesN